jgi:CspA family cold shock protein
MTVPFGSFPVSRADVLTGTKSPPSRITGEIRPETSGWRAFVLARIDAPAAILSHHLDIAALSAHIAKHTFQPSRLPDRRFAGLLGYPLIFANVQTFSACRGGGASPRAMPGTHQTEGIAMITGTVKFFNSAKGFGFIQPEDGSKDAFVHISAVERAGLSNLGEGQKVTYDLESGRDGKLSATNLQLV